MILPDIYITKQQFEDSKWSELIGTAGKQECHDYNSLFVKKVTEARDLKNTVDEVLYGLLSAITSFHFVPESSHEPFQPLFQFNNYRGLIPGDLGINNIKSLKELISTTTNNEVIARIADILWIVEHDYKMAETAIDAYLASAKELEDPNMWPPAADRIERALRIAILLQNGTLIQKVADQIEEILTRHNGTDPKFLSSKMMELLLEVKIGDANTYIALCEKIVSLAISEKDWYRARVYLELKAKWEVSIGAASDEQRNSLIRAAETYVSEAETAASTEAPSHLEASMQLQKAIEAYRRIGNTQTEVKEIHQKLLVYQEKIEGEMKQFSHEVDLGDTVQQSRDKVTDKTFQEAIKILALMYKSPDVNKLEMRVKKLMEDHPIQFLANRVSINKDGKVMVRHSAIGTGTAEEEDATVRGEMYDQANRIDNSLAAQAIIEPARKQIHLQHHGTIKDFLYFTSNNPFVPPGREFLVARALSAGLRGDFVEFLSIINPQFENSIRYLLYQNGFPTSSIDSDGVQKEHDLNRLLYMPEVKKIFGDNLTFDLQGLLVSQAGTNMRNTEAHGLIEHEEYFTVLVSYYWWLIIRIIVLMNMANKPDDSSKEQNNQETKDNN